VGPHSLARVRTDVGADYVVLGSYTALGEHGNRPRLSWAPRVAPLALQHRPGAVPRPGRTHVTLSEDHPEHARAAGPLGSPP
jgi:hypothetical protein